MNKFSLTAISALSLMALAGCSDAAETSKAKSDTKVPSITQSAVPAATAEKKAVGSANRAAQRKAFLDSRAAYEAARLAYQPHASRQKDMVASINKAQETGDAAKVKALRAEFKAERVESQALRTSLLEARKTFLEARAALPQKKAADPKPK